MFIVISNHLFQTYHIKQSLYLKVDVRREIEKETERETERKRKNDRDRERQRQRDNGER
jgi:hypothetical protein